MADLKSEEINNKNNIQSEKKSRAIKILKKEFQDLNKAPIINIGLTVGLINEDNIFEWKFTISGAKDSSYAHGIFIGKIIFPEDYPEKRPIIAFITPIYHPNVKHLKDNNHSLPLGNVSVNFINDWNPETKIIEILTKLYTIFYMANPECCFNKNIGKEYKENRELYELKIKYFTKKYACPTENSIEYDKDWDFTIDEKDPKLLKFKEQLNTNQIKKSNQSFDNNQVNKKITKTNSPDVNENYDINLLFYFCDNIMAIKCKSNDKIRDVINRVKSRFSWKNISNEILCIGNGEQLTNMDISIKNAGYSNYNTIIMIDTHDIIYC